MANYRLWVNEQTVTFDPALDRTGIHLVEGERMAFRLQPSEDRFLSSDIRLHLETFHIELVRKGAIFYGLFNPYQPDVYWEPTDQSYVGICRLKLTFDGTTYETEIFVSPTKLSAAEYETMIDDLVTTTGSVSLLGDLTSRAEAGLDSRLVTQYEIGPFEKYKLLETIVPVLVNLAGEMVTRPGMDFSTRNSTIDSGRFLIGGGPRGQVRGVAAICPNPVLGRPLPTQILLRQSNVTVDTAEARFLKHLLGVVHRQLITLSASIEREEGLVSAEVAKIRSRRRSEEKERVLDSVITLVKKVHKLLDGLESLAGHPFLRQIGNYSAADSHGLSARSPRSRVMIDIAGRLNQFHIPLLPSPHRRLDINLMVPQKKLSELYEYWVGLTTFRIMARDFSFDIVDCPKTYINLDRDKLNPTLKAGSQMVLSSGRKTIKVYYQKRYPRQGYMINGRPVIFGVRNMPWQKDCPDIAIEVFDPQFGPMPEIIILDAKYSHAGARTLREVNDYRGSILGFYDERTYLEVVKATYALFPGDPEEGDHIPNLALRGRIPVKPTNAGINTLRNVIRDILRKMRMA